MRKRKIVVSYYEMMVGGSTTSLLAFLNCIDKEKYEVDLQLYRNRGELLNEIPETVNLLPEACMYKGRAGNLIKKIKYVLTGTFFKARKFKKTTGKNGYALSEFQAKHLSKKSNKEYDYAIGFLEGWADRYIAYNVTANTKYAWIHSTFRNLATVPDFEKDWLKRIDNVVFVADNCAEEFKKDLPDFSNKVITIRNIVDSDLLNKRAEKIDENDSEYIRFRKADCLKIITVCRIDINTKGLDRVIKCAEYLKNNGREFLWYIVGDGPDQEKLKNMIFSHGVEGGVVAIGNRINPAPFIREADIFCMPSRYEGKPMVITESMILGTPPFVTRYLSAPEQIENGVDGIIVDNEDDTMLAVLDRFIDNPDQLLPMKEYLLTHEYGNSDYMREIEEKFLNVGA